ETYGIANKKTDDAGNWWFEACEGVTFPIEITFEMAEDDGYMAQYILHDLSRTNAREDYAALTDSQFANFRNIGLGELGQGILYRSSSPINPEIGRNAYADSAIEAAGIKTIVNLADSKDEAMAYPGFAETCYSGQNVIYLGLGVDFQADDFQAGLADGLRFMAENEGPYLVHCTEGKDRAGFVSALLSCLTGASYDEVIADYMITYDNYYGVKPGTDKYYAIAESNIEKSLKLAFGVEDLTSANLAAEAEEYFASIGLTSGEIAKLKGNLAKDMKTEQELAAEGSAAYIGETAYIVVRGDSLWLIAKNQLGDGKRWREIYNLNQAIVANPEVIFAGQKLAMPAK
ncbi:MAG: LysM peptidoglycan-binding domain-containing protein, partial [Lachnoclostridium sp.]|nr:LysM peptidoglycan-binding domain-containing protein [Lachnoclostridium sp.]